MASISSKTTSYASRARPELLKAIPGVETCVREACKDERWRGLKRAYVTMMVRRVQAALREQIARGEPIGWATRDQMLKEILRRVDGALEADDLALKEVINATGVIVHTNLGRALLPRAALEAITLAARAPVNLEYELEQGRRGDRDQLVEEELCALTGAEAATVVNNNAAAVLLALNTLAEGREVIVARGELIEIGGSFRMPDVMTKSGARMREVGTTNRTYLSDYARAIGPDTALLLKVHPSNYRIVGFTAEVSLADLVQLAAEHELPVMEDLGSGALIDLSAYGITREPLVEERIKAGASLVTFSGDKLLGGPQAGLIVGKSDLIDRLKANALKRALRCDKLTLAALSATLRLYLRSPSLGAELPTLRMLGRSAAELRQSAKRVVRALVKRLGDGFQIEAVPTTAQVGSGAMPAEELASWGVAVSHNELSPEEVAAAFRRGRPPIIGRIERDRFILDLRSVNEPKELLDAQFPILIQDPTKD
jgi:L-seryl-tRNA(Ser) seleniumtransferase